MSNEKQKAFFRAMAETVVKGAEAGFRVTNIEFEIINSTTDGDTKE